MSANIEQIKAMLERTGKTNLLQKQKVDLDKERLQLEAIQSLQKEQPESSNGKFVFPKFLYARTVNNKTIDVSYAPQSLDAVEYIKNDPTEQSEVDLEKEIDFFLYGTYTPERFPNTMQVRDEHTGLRVNDWKCWVNKPEYKVEFARHFYELGLKARKV